MATISFYASNCTYKAYATSHPSGISCPQLSVSNVTGTVTIYAKDVVCNSGYSLPADVYVNGSYVDYLQSTSVSFSATGVTNVQVIPTKSATVTNYSLYMNKCTGIDNYTYYINGSGQRQYQSGSSGKQIDFGTTRGYIELNTITPASGYSHPIMGSSTSGTTSWRVTWDDGSFDDKFIYSLSSGGIRYVTLSATLGATYYGHLQLYANGGTFPSTAGNYIYWPLSPASNYGQGGAYVSMSFPTSASYIPTRSGYTFLGWSTDSSATSAEKASGDPVSFTAKSTSSTNPTTLVYYAVWKKNQISQFYWDGASGTNDATLIAKGQPVSNITAARWNSLNAKIKELADACGASFTYTPVSSGDGITAARFNVARNGLSSIQTKLGASTTIPATQSSGGTMYATLFNGTGSLKGALNYLIGEYNNG